MQLRVRIELPDEIFAGMSTPVKVIICNDKRFLPSFLIRVTACDSKMLFSVVDKNSCKTGLLDVVFPQRGRHTIGDIHVSSAFPFNFFVRFRRIDYAPDVVIYPAARKCSLESLFDPAKKSKGDRMLDRSGFEAEVLSIRSYRYGDPQKYIHWKATARTGELKVKELSSHAGWPLVIDFDRVAVGDLEDKISCITYVIIKSCRLNMPVGLKIAGKIFRHSCHGSDAAADGSGKTAMLTELALYGAEQK